VEIETKIAEREGSMEHWVGEGEGGVD